MCWYNTLLAGRLGTINVEPPILAFWPGANWNTAGGAMCRVIPCFQA
jgi:hypothetical protein